MSNYITVEFTTPDTQGKVTEVTEVVRKAFLLAAQTWSAAISATKPPILLSGSIASICNSALDGALSFENRRIDNLLIIAEIVNIDGESRTLGRASICTLEQTTLMPAVGYIQLDAADVNKMISDNAVDRLERVIMHEIGHCLGIGVLWGGQFKKLLGRSSNGADVVYTGEHGVSQYNALRSGEKSVSVPVENAGGRGTAGSHWRNSVFGNELMTGLIGGATQPLSALTLGSLQDLGYSVDLSKAEAYTIPNSGDFDGSGDDVGDDVPTGDGTIKTVPGFFPDQPLNNLLAYIGIGILLSMIVLVGVGVAYKKIKARKSEDAKEKERNVEMQETGFDSRDNRDNSDARPTFRASGNPFRDPTARSRTVSDLTKEYYKGTNPFAQDENDQVAPV